MVVLTSTLYNMRSTFGQRGRKFLNFSLVVLFVMAILYWNHADLKSTRNGQGRTKQETLQLIRQKITSNEITRQPQPTPSKAGEIQWCSPKLTYLNGSDKLERGKNQENSGLVGLVSFPGSGNSWVRYLLQQSTGIFTGSVYIDGELRKNGLPNGKSHLVSK